MFDVSPQDITLLGDQDLRDLVARLCECEVKLQGFPSSCVTAGGHQDAPDGGVDVRVSLPQSSVIAGFVPHAQTVFQVKKQEMQPAAIRDEMRPKNALRPVIQSLGELGGAYVIASSESTTDLQLRNRLAAMSEAVSDLSPAHLLALEFYDCGRLANWVRNHPSLIMWVKDKIGKALPGWRPYGQWAYVAIERTAPVA